MANLCLMLFLFFNPFGFDFVFILIQSLINSYWITIGIFYCLSALFFILYFLYYHKTFLMIGTFFLPLGYDILFKTILDYTNSYLITDLVFYSISFMFLITYLIITKKNIATDVDKRISQANIEILKIKSKL